MSTEPLPADPSAPLPEIDTTELLRRYLCDILTYCDGDIQYSATDIQNIGHMARTALSLTEHQPTQDANVESVREKLRQRAERGMSKYGVNTQRDDLTEDQWLQHAQEEAMDLAVYLEVLRKRRAAMRDTAQSLTQAVEAQCRSTAQAQQDAVEVKMALHASIDIHRMTFADLTATRTALAASQGECERLREAIAKILPVWTDAEWEYAAGTANRGNMLAGCSLTHRQVLDLRAALSTPSKKGES